MLLLLLGLLLGGLQEGIVVHNEVRRSWRGTRWMREIAWVGVRRGPTASAGLV